MIMVFWVLLLNICYAQPDAVKQSPDLRLALGLCGIDAPNLETYKAKNIPQSEIDCIESKSAEVLKLINDEKSREDERKNCNSLIKLIDENAMTAAQKDQVIKCLVKLRR